MSIRYIVKLIRTIFKNIAKFNRKWVTITQYKNCKYKYRDKADEPVPIIMVLFLINVRRNDG